MGFFSMPKNKKKKKKMAMPVSYQAAAIRQTARVIVQKFSIFSLLIRANKRLIYSKYCKNDFYCLDFLQALSLQFTLFYFFFLIKIFIPFLKYFKIRSKNLSASPPLQYFHRVRKNNIVKCLDWPKFLLYVCIK